AVYGTLVRSNAALAMASSGGVNVVAPATPRPAARDRVLLEAAPWKNCPATEITSLLALTAAVVSELNTSFPSIRCRRFTVFRLPILNPPDRRASQRALFV